eukprot:TRINITY_DN956_c0_g2_i3.p1 TRINITY_DN956_c0_g2~~TRINITY_DN956_c0_g2_i3.p1  ORF type:complete len:369 (+),score=73.66 TRINITY_DN956_c0_g2_i3:150-1256(+)
MSVRTFLYNHQHLRNFCISVFTHCGVPINDANTAADVLITSDLRGIDSHGVARLHSYFDMLKAGRINPKPNIKIVRETPSTATIDGDNGLGLVVGPYCNQVAIDKAEKCGSGWVSVCNTNHFGIAGYYVLEALKKDIIGWAMTNSTPLVAPLWGADKMLGTNPIAIAFPGKEEPPVVIDFATSACAFGKIEIANRKGVDIPKGWAIDKDGNDTVHPQEMIAGGALLPLGSDFEGGGHKGYCLASMVDILTSVLSGANWGPFAPPFMLKQKISDKSVGKGIGHFFGAMRIDGFIEPDEFKKQIDDWRRTMYSTRPVPGTRGPIIPGDPERLAVEERSKNGIPLLLPVVEDLRRIASQIPGLELKEIGEQ